MLGTQPWMPGQRMLGPGDKVEALASSTNPEAALSLDYQLLANKFLSCVSQLEGFVCFFVL